MAKNTLGLVFFPAFDWMISPGHPERQERLLYTRDQLEEEGLFDCAGTPDLCGRLFGGGRCRNAAGGTACLCSRASAGTPCYACSTRNPWFLYY